MKVMIDQEQKRLIKRFKAMLNQYGIDRNAELGMLSGYNVESCRDLTAYELIELCDSMQKTFDNSYKKLDKKRKQVLAAAISVNGLRGYPTTIEYAKQTILRAASDVKSFNDITEQRLNSLYAAFNHIQNDLKKVREITVTEIENSAKLN